MRTKFVRLEEEVKNLGLYWNKVPEADLLTWSNESDEGDAIDENDAIDRMTWSRKLTSFYLWLRYRGWQY